MSAAPIGVLVMAYGGPDRLEQVEPYLLDVRGGRETPAHVVAEVVERYRQIGGRSPILEHTRAQAAAIQDALQTAGRGCFQTFVGMRHWHPFLDEAVAEMLAAGVSRAVGLVMAPHYSRMSIGAYTKRLQQAIADQGADLEIAAIESWKEDPGYLDCLEERIRAGLAAFAPEARPGVHLVFTAHSLPQRILEWDDPYPAELQATCERLQARFPEQPAHFAYQSAAMTSEPWLGPDAGDRMLELIEDGVQDFLLAPIGFVSEHVEILYDVDIEFKARVTAAGGRLVRIEMPNDHPAMAVSLAGRVRSAAEEAGWL